MNKFEFAFDDLYRWPAFAFGVRPKSASVTIEGDRVEARFGPWSVTTPLGNVRSAEVTGPYSTPKTIGPAHLSFADNGLTFATNNRAGVCIAFNEPVTGMDPLGLLRHPGLTVTVADPEGLGARLQARSPARTDLEKLQDVQAAQDQLHTMTAAQLRELADEHGVDHTSSMKKSELVALLHAGLGPELLTELGAST